jgi:hypothetical protein
MSAVKSQSPHVPEAADRVERPPRRIPRGVGLLVGVGASLALWSALIAGVRALIR